MMCAIWSSSPEVAFRRGSRRWPAAGGEPDVGGGAVLARLDDLDEVLAGPACVDLDVGAELKGAGGGGGDRGEDVVAVVAKGGR